STVHKPRPRRSQSWGTAFNAEDAEQSRRAAEEITAGAQRAQRTTDLAGRVASGCCSPTPPPTAAGVGWGLQNRQRRGRLGRAVPCVPCASAVSAVLRGPPRLLRVLRVEIPSRYEAEPDQAGRANRGGVGQQDLDVPVAARSAVLRGPPRLLRALRVEFVRHARCGVA